MSKNGLAIVTILTAISHPSCVHADQLIRDTGMPTTPVLPKDITDGVHYLLRDDDVVMVQLKKETSGELTTSLIRVDTSNSKLGTPETQVLHRFNPPSGFSTAESLWQRRPAVCSRRPAISSPF